MGLQYYNCLFFKHKFYRIYDLLILYNILFTEWLKKSLAYE